MQGSGGSLLRGPRPPRRLQQRRLGPDHPPELQRQSPSPLPGPASSPSPLAACPRRGRSASIPPGRRRPARCPERLLDDTPIYNGDFADPFALRTADDLYIYSSNTQTTQYAPGAHVPVIELAPQFGIQRPIPRGRTADAAQVDRLGIPVGAVGVDATGRHLCHVLLDAGDDSARVSGQDASVGVRQDHQRGVQRDVHLARDQRQSRRAPSSMTRRLLSCARSRRGARSTRACSSHPTARRGCSGRATETAATCPPPSIPSNSRPMGSRWSVRPTG